MFWKLNLFPSSGEERETPTHNPYHKHQAIVVPICACFIIIFFSADLTMSVFKSGLSAGFFFRQLSTKFLKLAVKIPAGSLGGGSFTI
jgi:hypothetical protein